MQGSDIKKAFAAHDSVDIQGQKSNESSIFHLRHHPSSSCTAGASHDGDIASSKFPIDESHRSCCERDGHACKELKKLLRISKDQYMSKIKPGLPPI
jgi:hypothetical protein